MNTIDFQWVDNDRVLAQLCEQWSTQEAIAVDTEFVRTRTYYPQIGLLQIADAHGVYLVDPLALNDTQPLANLLANPAVVKVVHACSEDLEVFQHSYGMLPASLFDTQIAAAFVGYGVSIGYANLLREVKDIDIQKQETRSDWLQRPLSDAQLNYAALDVVYLLDIYRHLVEQLTNAQRLEWVQSDCRDIVEKLRNTNNEEQYYLRIRSAWKLKPDQLAVLKNVCRWRERQSREFDITRSRILKDATLFDMAMKCPSDMQQLKRVADISSRFIHESGKTVVALINQTLDDPVEFPSMLDRPLDKEQTTVLKSLKQCVHAFAEQENIPQELLVRKKDYEAFIRSAQRSNQGVKTYSLPESLSDWRKNLVGPVLQNGILSSQGEV